MGGVNLRSGRWPKQEILHASTSTPNDHCCVREAGTNFAHIEGVSYWPVIYADLNSLFVLIAVELSEALRDAEYHS